MLALATAAFAYRSLLLWRPGWQGLPPVEGWFFATAETAPQIVFGIVAALLVHRRRRIRAALAAPEPAPGLAVPFLLAGLTLFGWSQHVEAPDLTLLSLPALGIGAALLWAGRPLAGTLVLPSLLLLLAFPLPPVLRNELAYSLQLVTARLAAMGLDSVGITAVQEGDMVHLADHSFEVIETCSGLRGIKILTLLALTWVAFFEVGRLHGILLVAAAPVIAFVLNGARVLTLILSPEADALRPHATQGIVVFVGGALAIYAVDQLLLRMLPPPRPSTTTGAGPVPSAAGPSRAAAVGLMALVAAIALASVATPRAGAPPPKSFAAVALPPEIDGWTTRPLEPDSDFLGSVRFDRRKSVAYERDGESVSVFVGVDDLRRRDRSLLSTKNELPGRGWQVEERSGIRLGTGAPRWQAVLARSGGRRILTVHGYQGTSGRLREALRAVLALDQSALRRPRGIRVIRLGTPVEGGPDGRREAEARLSRMFERLRPWLLEGVAQPAGARAAPK